MEYLPVSSIDESALKKLSAYNIDATASLDLLADISQNKVSGPSKLEELTIFHTLGSHLSVEVALALDLPIAAIDGKAGKHVFVQEYLQYVELQEEAQKVRWGIAIRWVVNYKTMEFHGKTSTITMVAASAEIGAIEANAMFQVVGIGSAKIRQAIPAPVKLNVETYQQMNDAFMKIIGLIDDPDTKVTPQVVGVPVKGSIKPNVDESLAVCWALTNISYGRSLQEALNKSRYRNSVFDEAVKAVYIDEASVSDEGAKPPEDAKAQAYEKLRGYKLDT